MEKIRRAALLLLLFCLALGLFPVSAADERPGTVADSSAPTDQIQAEYTVYPWDTDSYISKGRGHMILTGTGRVTLIGETYAYQTVNEIKVTLQLQRLEGNSWVNVTTLGPKTGYKTDNVSVTNTYSVARGYYYRVLGSHTIMKNGVPESLVNYSNAVFVS